MRRFLLVTMLVGSSVALGQAQSPASADGRSEEPPKYSVPQDAPCAGQPRSLSELAVAFRDGHLPSPSETTGDWVEIGDFSDRPTPWPKFRYLNCSGLMRRNKFDFVLVANGYSVELHVIDMYGPQTVAMEPDHEGSVEFPEVYFGGEGPTSNYRCRLTQRGTLACLWGRFAGTEFKRMAVEKTQIYQAPMP